MGRLVLRKIGILTGLASIGVLAVGVGSAPMVSSLAAQGFSNGYEFLQAVEDRDGDVATEMLNEPGTTVINTRDITTGETGLHIVTKRRDTLWVRFLLQRGADPNIRDSRGVYPLQIAASLGFVEGLEELIKRGAQIDVTDRAGETPLIASVHRRDIPIIRRLLAEGADPDHTDNSGRSARDYAALLNSNSLILSEFEKADKEREEKGTQESYGPSF